MDPFNSKSKSQGTVAGGVTAGVSDPAVTSNPVADEPVVPAAPTEPSLVEPVEPVATAPDVSAPPAPPAETVAAPTSSDTPLVGGVGGAVSSEEQDQLKTDTSEELPSPTFGQTPSASKPDETGGTGGTGLAGE